MRNNKASVSGIEQGEGGQQNDMVCDQRDSIFIANSWTCRKSQLDVDNRQISKLSILAVRIV